MSDTTTDPGGRSVEELEREVERERRKVASTIDALQDKADMGNVVQEIVRLVGENGGVASRNLGRTLRDNPLPALLTGVGLAWLMAGGGGPRLHRDDWDDDTDDSTYLHDDPLLRQPEPLYDVERARGVAYSGSVGAPSAQAGTDSGPGLKDRVSGTVRRTGAATSATADTASASVRGAASGAGEAVRDASDAARERARRARARAMRTGRQGRETLETMMHDQPLVFGALALAVGAAFGGALPRSQTEDRMFGESSAKLKARARQVAETEGAKVQATAGAVAREAVNMADEAAGHADSRTPSGEEVVQRAESGLRKAADRLAEAGRQEAERQNLGADARREMDKAGS